jgi:hypothetical protein
MNEADEAVNASNERPVYPIPEYHIRAIALPRDKVVDVMAGTSLLDFRLQLYRASYR